MRFLFENYRVNVLSWWPFMEKVVVTLLDCWQGNKRSFKHTKLWVYKLIDLKANKIDTKFINKYKKNVDLWTYELIE